MFTVASCLLAVPFCVLEGALLQNFPVSMYYKFIVTGVLTSYGMSKILMMLSFLDLFSFDTY